jgi:hypothetical protein
VIDMDQPVGTAPLPRCLLVLVTVTAVVATLVTTLLPDLLGIGTKIRSGAPFDEVLVDVSALAVSGCSLWLWLATAVVVGEAARGRTTRHHGVPRVVRRVVLATCGAALAGGLGAPAQAEESQRSDDRPATSRVEGLPLPDRATTAMHVSQVFARAAAHPVRAGAPATRVVVVRPGDTLWDFARADLPPEADDDAVAAHVREIHQANRAVIGADPDLIRPHQRLRMPQPRTIREEHR